MMITEVSAVTIQSPTLCNVGVDELQGARR